MFRGLQLRVVFLAVAIGYLVPFSFLWWLKWSFFGGVPASERGGSDAFQWLVILAFIPLLIGYVAAWLSPVRPQLHAVFAGLVAWFIAAWLGSGFFVGILYVCFSATGAVVHATRRIPR
jgi:fructose-specific phosphotransferase system IIC component